LRVTAETKGNVKARYELVELYNIADGSNAQKIAVKEISTVPKEFALSQNYPNPFNPETNIRYELPKDGVVTLRIYDLLGREVRTMVSEPQTAGYYTVRWDGRNSDNVPTCRDCKRCVSVSVSRS
jgi:hypothetical protein